jgi:succinoglycan biosynthesis protein ExoA
MELNYKLNLSSSSLEIPFVSVLMPVYNELSFIRRSLNAVLNQQYPSDRLEVIVADGMSNDGTREALLSIKDSYNNLTVIDNPGRIVSTALNLAMKTARGDIIIRVDGHCEIAPDYIANCVRHILLDHVDAVGGSVTTKGLTRTANAIAIAMSSRFGVGDSAFRTMSGRTMLVDTVPFPAYSRAIVSLAGAYDEEQIRNQDDEYNSRIRKLGGRIMLAEDVNAVYFSRASFESLWRQFFGYGYWKVRVMQKHPKQIKFRQIVPLLFVLTLFVLSVFAACDRTGLWILLSLLSSYLVASIVAAILLVKRYSIITHLLVGLAFPTMHLAYGIGFLSGLVVFWRHWAGAEHVSDAGDGTEKAHA